MRMALILFSVLALFIALVLFVDGKLTLRQVDPATDDSHYQLADRAQIANATIRQVSALVAETRALMQGQPLTRINDPSAFASPELNLNSILIASGAVPSEMVTDTATLKNPFGGTTSVSAGNYGQDLIMVMATNIPPSLCVRLIAGEESTILSTGAARTGTWATTAVAYGQTAYAVSTSVFPIGMNSWPLNPTQAGVSCNYGSAAHGAVGREGTPATPRLTGNVSVFLFFAVDA